MRILSPQSALLPKGVVNLANFTAIYGTLYGLPFSTGSAATSQVFPLPPAISTVEDKSSFIPFANAAGQTLNIGDVVFWKLDPLARKWAELANYYNQYDPAGVVAHSAVKEGKNGWLAQSGRIMNVKVLGGATVVAGSVLAPVLGQVYLGIGSIGSTAGARFHFRILENHLSATVLLKRVRVDCTI